MKVEYDLVRDLLYIWFAVPGEKAARTETVTAGVHADFNRHDKLVGIGILNASETLRQKVQFEVPLLPTHAETVAA
jgi:uncharacterized protein YuzE